MSQARAAKTPALFLLGAFYFAFWPVFLVPTGRVDLAQRLDLLASGRQAQVNFQDRSKVYIQGRKLEGVPG